MERFAPGRVGGKEARHGKKHDEKAKDDKAKKAEKATKAKKAEYPYQDLKSQGMGAGRSSPAPYSCAGHGS